MPLNLKLSPSINTLEFPDKAQMPFNTGEKVDMISEKPSICGISYSDGREDDAFSMSSFRSGKFSLSSRSMVIPGFNGKIMSGAFSVINRLLLSATAIHSLSDPLQSVLP